MIILRFKLMWLLVALIGAYFVVSEAQAFTSTINNWYTVDFNQIFCPPGPDQLDCNDVLNTVKDFSEIYILGVPSDPNVAQSVQITGWVFSGDTYFISFTPSLGQFSSGTYSGITISDIDPNGNPTWGDGGFWGSTGVVSDSVDGVIDGMEASVQATGADLWPMLIFLGIVIAFAIFGWLVTSVKSSVKPKTPRTARKEFDMDSFNSKADELMSFYKKTGGTDPELIKQIKKNVTK